VSLHARCRYFERYLSTWSASFGQPAVPLPSKQSFWDRPGLQADRYLIEASFVEPAQIARYLAAVAPHSGDWLLSLPIANCGLRLDDEAVRVAVGMRLGVSLCTSAVVVPRLMPRHATPWSAERHRAELPGIML